MMMSKTAVISKVLTYVVVISLFGVTFAQDVSAQGARTDHIPPTYSPPLYTEVIDTFRPPKSFAGRGNRGLEYGSTWDQIVYASSSGWVVFAGPVGGRGVVSIEHADGIRTTYTGMDEIWVDEYDYLEKGHTLGLAADSLHFGAKLGRHYLDPQILLDISADPPTKARLIVEPP